MADKWDKINIVNNGSTPKGPISILNNFGSYIFQHNIPFWGTGNAYLPISVFIVWWISFALHQRYNSMTILSHPITVALKDNSDVMSISHLQARGVNLFSPQVLKNRRVASRHHTSDAMWHLGACPVFEFVVLLWYSWPWNVGFRGCKAEFNITSSCVALHPSPTWNSLALT